MEHIQSYDQLAKRRKIDDSSSELFLNNAYTEQSFIESLSNSFCLKKSSVYDNGAKIVSEPFTCCLLPNFLLPNDYLFRLKSEVEEVEVKHKSNDLYQFKQSSDLGEYSSSAISSLKKLFYGGCLQWMKKITNIPLIDKVDISVSCYTYTDHLLCHDDELEGRRIAFILYLTPDWKESDGGTLDLFGNVNGQPSEICTSFVPEWDNFIFFEVSPISFHQVSEIVSYKSRISISGWFHGPPIKPSLPRKETILFKSPTSVPVDITKWINPIYMEGKTQLDIRENFEENSEIELLGFLQERKYDEVCKALEDSSICWKQSGPPSRRKYGEISSNDDMPSCLRECQDFFCSEAFFLILSNLTGLKLHPICEEGDCEMGKVMSVIRKWNHGSYTLLNDQSFSERSSLNAVMYFNCQDWDTECGAYTSYVGEDEKEELLRIDPKPNSLALVYITEGTSFFVKYINGRCTKQSVSCFNDIFSMYVEEE